MGNQSSASAARAEQARRDLGRTEVTRTRATVLSLAFVAIILSVVLGQHMIGWREWRRDGSAPSFRSYGEFRGLWAAVLAGWRGAATPSQRVLRANAVLLQRINAFQDALDDDCFVALAARPWAQTVMCRLGVGNEQAFIGRDGWLFYEPGLRSLSGPGFLLPRQIQRRSRTGNEYRPPPQPDPVKAIVHFRQQLEQRGIELVVVPAPGKASVHPEKFAASLDRIDGPLHNPSFPDFLARLAEAGVHVYDSAPSLFAAKQAGTPQYLKTDTHWRPEAMQAVARELAAFVTARGLLPAMPSAASAPRWTRHPRTVRHHGDIALMLGLPANQRLYAEEEVAIATVVRAGTADERRNRPNADVLLLGDSFANIYSQADMGWGEGAGLAGQLACELQRPVEPLVRNADGAFAAREMLALELARGIDRLAGKRLVVWEFAARELAVGNWKLIDLKLGAGPPEIAVEPSSGTLVTGLVVEVSDRPRTGVPYKDFLMKLHLTNMKDEQGATFGSGEGVVHVTAMRNRVVLPIAAVKAAASTTLRLSPWANVKGRYERWTTGTFDDVMMEVGKTLYWGEPAAPGASSAPSPEASNADQRGSQ